MYFLANNLAIDIFTANETIAILKASPFYFLFLINRLNLKSEFHLCYINIPIISGTTRIGGKEGAGILN